MGVLSGNLASQVKITKAKAAQTAATTAIESDIIDMQGYLGVMFFTTIGTANAGNYLKIQQGEESTLSDAADLEGTKVVCGGNGEIVGTDIYRPTERYVRAHVTRTASTTCGEIYAIQYGPSLMPVDNDTDGTISFENHVSPDEGTA